MFMTFPFVLKREPVPEPWWRFGGPREAFEKWAPHICGICGLAMVIRQVRGAAPSLWELTEQAVRTGVFVEHSDGSIQGAYHRPLAQLAAQYGVPATCFAPLSIYDVGCLVDAGRPVLLSIQLERIASNLNGSHLILVFGRVTVSGARAFVLHDCAEVVGKPGCGIVVSGLDLTIWSNGRGLAFL